MRPQFPGWRLEVVRLKSVSEFGFGAAIRNFFLPSFALASSRSTVRFDNAWVLHFLAVVPMRPYA